MPNIKSAKKRVKVAAAKTLQNKMINSQLKTEIKKANVAIESNAADKAEAVKVAVKRIDQAAAKGILHKNTAARKKSALDKKLNAGCVIFPTSQCIRRLLSGSRFAFYGTF